MHGKFSYVGAGIIIVSLGFNEPRYLMLKGAKSGVWSFPKGHPDTVDVGSQLRTAVRETYEETGYNAGCEYDIIGNPIRFGKRPYWLGVIRDSVSEVRINCSEHSESAWLTWEEISALNANTDVRAWVKKGRLPGGVFMQLLSVSRHFMVKGGTSVP